MESDIAGSVTKDGLTNAVLSVVSWKVGAEEYPTAPITDGEIAMHYIYEEVINQDEDRRQVLKQFTDESVRLRVIVALNTASRSSTSSAR